MFSEYSESESCKQKELGLDNSSLNSDINGNEEAFERFLDDVKINIERYEIKIDEVYENIENSQDNPENLGKVMLNNFNLL